MTEKINQVHQENHGVEGAKKVYAALNRSGHKVDRCTVVRFMRRVGHHCSLSARFLI
ncbi:IS3 family transposase [Paeniglutamicibacter psychrophenolicus]|uniref:IS3 family transposase n=1 Tax=Paeniglutamicibacter psychrophenolicus TaxID=257454 RepID=UPI001AE8B445